MQQQNSISIHAPLAGCDDCARPITASQSYFNPRTPCGVRPLYYNITIIQINFNPRTPCGVRLLINLLVRSISIFQSTHPLRGATLCSARLADQQSISIHAPLAGCDIDPAFMMTLIPISIHAPLAGCDPPISRMPIVRSNFNPRTPCGVRQRKCTKFSAHFAITDNSIGFPRPECRLLGHFLLIPGACSARERVRTFL